MLAARLTLLEGMVARLLDDQRRTLLSQVATIERERGISPTTKEACDQFRGRTTALDNG